MAPFNVVYYPPNDQHHSPEEIHKNIADPSERAGITDKLRRISQIDPPYWGQVVKLKLIDKNLYQITSHDYRIYLGLDHASNYIVVFHICRKQGQKAKKEDLDRARANRDEYFAT